MKKKIESGAEKKRINFEIDEKSQLYQFVESNLASMCDALNIEDELKELEDHFKKDSAYLGAMDKRRAANKIKELEIEKNKILDILINKLEKNKLNLEILNPDQLNFVLKYVDKKNDKENDINEEVSYDIARMMKNRMEENKKEKTNYIDEISNKDISKNQETEKNDLAAVREKIKNLPEEADDFDSQAKLLKIYEVERKQTGNPRKKKELIREYANNMVRQQLGIAEINIHLEKEICENKNFELDQLLSYLKQQAKELKLSSWQMNRYEKLFDNLRDATNSVEKFWIKNEGRKPEEIFSDVFDVKPVGKIDIYKEKIPIIFLCYDINDYAKTSSDNEDEEDTETLSSGVFLGSLSPELGGTIVINVSEGYGTEDINTTIIHEKRHMVDYFMEKTFSSVGINYEFAQSHKDDDIRMEYYEELMNEAQTEIFAFFKSGIDTQEIFRTLTQDYFPFLKKGEYQEIKKQYREQREDINIMQREYIRAVLTNKAFFKRALKDSIKVLDGLESVGFSREKIIAMLQNTRFDFWPKYLLRLERSEYFIQELRENIKHKLEYHKSMQKELEDENEKYKMKNNWFIRVADYIKRGDGYQISSELEYAKKEILNLNNLLNLLVNETK